MNDRQRRVLLECEFRFYLESTADFLKLRIPRDIKFGEISEALLREYNSKLRSHLRGSSV